MGDDLVFVTFSSLTGLPDGRGFELVTPVDNHNAEVYPPTSGGPTPVAGFSASGPYQAAVGGGIAYEGEATPEGNGEEGDGLANQYLARNTGSGWVQSALSLSGHDSVVYEGFASDLSESVFRAGGGVDEGSEGGSNERSPVLGEVEVPLTKPVLYVRNDQTGAVRALFTHLEGSDSESLKTLSFAGGSEDFGRLLFEAPAALTPGAPPSGPGVNNLYEWTEGRLSPVNVLPGGAWEPEASFGAAEQGSIFKGLNPLSGAEHSNDISRDGSWVFWTGLRSHGLYMTEAGGEAVQLDVHNEGVSGKSGDGVFWTATPDGGKVFFTDTNDLTGEADATAGQPDLYEYDSAAPKVNGWWIWRPRRRGSTRVCRRCSVRAKTARLCISSRMACWGTANRTGTAKPHGRAHVSRSPAWGNAISTFGMKARSGSLPC